MAENKIRENEIEKEGFWDYLRMTIASLVAVSFFCILGAHLFLGIDVNIDQDGHFSYELGNHPGVTETRRIYKREGFIPEVIRTEPLASGTFMPKMKSDLTGEWFPGREVWVSWPEKPSDKKSGDMRRE